MLVLLMTKKCHNYGRNQDIKWKVLFKWAIIIELDLLVDYGKTKNLK